MDPFPTEVRRLLRRQDGVLARHQLLGLDVADHDLRRWRRQRLLVAVHTGVYLDHTGAATWLQRAWAAVLAVEPAALSGCCALRAAHGSTWRGHDDDGPVHVAVETSRRPTAPPGVVVHRVSNLGPRVQWHRSPPRLRVEEAVVDVAARAVDEHAAVAVIGAVVGARSTTAARLLGALDGRERLPRRAFLSAVLRDVALGACSALEVAYLRDVERSHHLPTGVRQAPRGDRPGLRDVLYADQGVVVELDGRLDHATGPGRDADLERDLSALSEGLTTARVGWAQVVGDPCRTAAAVARLLERHGWAVALQECPRCAPGGAR